MSSYKENDEFWLNLARGIDDHDNSTARNCTETTIKIKKESEIFQNYLDAHPGCTTGPAMYPDSDDDLSDNSAQSVTSCGQVEQLEEQLLQLWTDKMAPVCCKNNLCEENEILREQLIKQDEAISIMKSTISAQIEIIAKQVDENLELKAQLDSKPEAKPAVSCFKQTITTSSSVRVEAKTEDSLGHEQQEVLDMVSMVEKLSQKYSPKFARYKSKNFTNSSNSSKKKKKPSIVPKCFYTMWKLLLAPPPPLIFVKDSKPRVNWTKLRPQTLRNLPKPSEWSVQSCSQDPTFYEGIVDKDDPRNWSRPKGIPLIMKPSRFLSSTSPFGTLLGLLSDQGVISMPEDSIDGYIWSQSSRAWVIASC